MTASPFVAGADELELALRATLLIGAAWAAAAMLRKAGASAATRHLVWLLGIAALLALPLLWWLAPPLRLPVLLAEAPVAAAAALPSPATGALPVTSGSLEWDNAFVIAYMLGVAVMLLRPVVRQEHQKRHIGDLHIVRSRVQILVARWEHRTRESKRQPPIYLGIIALTPSLNRVDSIRY